MAAFKGEDHKLHVIFLPYLTPSHIIPLVHAARLFASRGVNVSIITTPNNATIFQSSVNWTINSGYQITVHTLPFPSKEVGLPEGIENFSSTRSGEDIFKVWQAIQLLQDPMENLIRALSPDCIFSDMFFPWTVDLAEELLIPRLVFYANNFLYPCIDRNLKLYTPHESVKTETERFLIPNLPDKVEMKKSQLPDYVKGKTEFGKFLKLIEESELRSYGTVHDTFYELEPAYVEYYKKVKSKKSWHIGPLFHFSNRHKVETSAGDDSNCLGWLDAQRVNSVVYICFGSIVKFPDAQLTEIALALMAANHPFIWVVRRGSVEESWLPEGFEEKTQGMIIRGWAPQMKILNHPAIGGFMTHCGWNSTLEATVAGVPLITWPLFAEQFYNEKLVEIVGIGVGVGAEVWNMSFEVKSPVVGKDQIEKAVTRLMGGSDEAELIRRRSKEVAEKAKGATEEGGSSYNDLTALIDEINACALEKKPSINDKP